MKLLYFGSYFIIFSAVLMPIYWILFAVFLPMKENYIRWVSSKNWIWVNSVGFLGAIMGMLASFFIAVYVGESLINYLLLTCVIIGSVMMTSLLYFEAYILPGMVSSAPALVDQSSILYNSKSFKLIRLLGSFIFGAGYIIWAVIWLLSGKIPVWSSICIMIGAPVFSAIYLPGNLRLLGILLYSAGLMGIGLQILMSF